MRCAPMPRAWKWAQELSAKTMRPGWLAWAAFVLEAGFRSRISALETVGSQVREGHGSWPSSNAHIAMRLGR